MHTISPELAESLRQELRERPDQMLLEMSRRHGVSEFAILSVLGPPNAVQLDAVRWEALLHGFAALGNVRVIVSNSGVTMESRGEFGGFSRTGDYLNVQTSSLDLHVRWPAIQGAMAVRKPSHQSRRPTASVQLFDGEGAAIMKVFLLFGEREDATDARRLAFDRLVDEFGLRAS